MDLTTLGQVREIARHEHVGRAAASLSVAQPSLSRSLARLERELGAPLFDRVGRRLRLNADGERFLSRVGPALDDLEDARREAREASGLDHGRVAVASETLLTVTALASRFHRQRPGVDLTLRTASATEMPQLLTDGAVDLCLVSAEVGAATLARRELLREPVHLAVPPDHRLAGRTTVGFAELAEERFVVNRAGHWQRLLLDRLCAEAGFAPRISCESDEPGAGPELVGAGLGITLMPEMARAAGSRSPVAWVEVTDAGCERTLSAVWQPRRHLPATVREFLQAATAFWAPDRPGRD